MMGTQAAGALISCLVIANGKDVKTANNPAILIKNRGPLELTEDWASGVLKSLEWSKGKGTTKTMECSKQFLEEEKLSFQKKYPV